MIQPTLTTIVSEPNVLMLVAGFGRWPEQKVLPPEGHSAMAAAPMPVPGSSDGPFR